MKRKFVIQIGILSLLLAVPIFAFLFLKFFGKNHYQVRTYYPLEVHEKQNSIGKLYYDTTFYTVPDFKFTNQDSLAGSLYGYGEKLIILHFFFTRCPGICPKMLSNMSKIYETFKGNTNVQLLSITVDPEYDMPTKLKTYRIKFGVDTKQWELVRSDRRSTYTFGFYGVKLPADTVDKTLHSEKLILLDEKKHIRGYYTGTQNKEIERLITEVKILLYNKKEN